MRRREIKGSRGGEFLMRKLITGIYFLMAKDRCEREFFKGRGGFVAGSSRGQKRGSGSQNMRSEDRSEDGK